MLKLISQKFKKFICLPAADGKIIQQHWYYYLTLNFCLCVILGTTPVYHAAQQGQLEALKFLVEKCKCKLTVGSDDGAKPIHADPRPLTSSSVPDLT